MPKSVTDLGVQEGLREIATGRKARKSKPKSTVVTRKSSVKLKQTSRGLLATARKDERKTIYQLRPRDEFGEMGARRKGALKQAFENGHQMGPFRKRHDQYGSEDSYCLDCNRAVTVTVEEPVVYKLSHVYGHVLTEKCNRIMVPDPPKPKEQS